MEGYQEVNHHDLEGFEVTTIQLAGVAAAALGIAGLWGPAAWGLIKKMKPIKPPAPVPDTVYDDDYADLQALRRLEDRAELLGCIKFEEGLALIKTHFFGGCDDFHQA